MRYIKWLQSKKEMNKLMNNTEKIQNWKAVDIENEGDW